MTGRLLPRLKAQIRVPQLRIPYPEPELVAFPYVNGSFSSKMYSTRSPLWLLPLSARAWGERGYPASLFVAFSLEQPVTA